MTLWLKARAAPVVIASAAVSLVMLALPFTALSATPSPAGATVALAVLLALVVPVVLGWGMTRTDRLLETASTRPIVLLDFALALSVGGGVAVADVVLRLVGPAPTGLIAGRAAATFVGLLLVAVAAVGWRTASTVPVIYLVTVLVVGGGSDSAHPAAWAWIASPETDGGAIALAVLTLIFGSGAYLKRRGSLPIPHNE